jgi:hypothetical protein
VLGRRISLAALCIVFLASLTLAVPRAYADESITCVGTESLTYSPGLKLRKTTVTLHVTGTFSPCVSTNPAIESGITGTPPGGVPAALACMNLLSSSDGEAVIHWNNGTTSRYSFYTSSQTVAGQLISTTTGQVIAGEFLGRLVLITVVSPVPNLLDCVSPGGLTERTGNATLVIM